MAEKNSLTNTWLQRNGELLAAATQSPFILHIRNGTLDFAAYKLWLGQDYYFVKEFVRFVASVLAKAPESTTANDLDALLSGLAALQQELLWFQSEASNWDVDLENLSIHRATHEYRRFLKNLSKDDVEYSLALSVLWAIEMVYNESFAICLSPGAQPSFELLGACKRWGSLESKSYCSILKDMADKALREASPELGSMAEDAFRAILTKEINFWGMSFDEAIL